VVASDPTNEEALFNLGLLSRQSGQNDKAIERFATLLEAHPENIQARFLLGLTYMDIGKNKEAIEQFEIVKKKGNDPAITATVDGYLEEIK
jgi:tetratricopeptide (TPR) repeat protein